MKQQSLTRSNPWTSFTFLFWISIILTMLSPELCFASVEGTLQAVQSKLVDVILPLVAVLGLVFAGFSFVTGSPNARQHLILAIMGAAIGFGAQSIVGFIRGLVD
ncbi:MAG: TrbC/VirB2 family protein [Proteobacteria bacterium]|nr:TrbC/VirB2 family protein [Pseudomonadota bacterium]